MFIDRNTVQFWLGKDKIEIKSDLEEDPHEDLNKKDPFKDVLGKKILSRI
jgi:hypothetical protein